MYLLEMSTHNPYNFGNSKLINAYHEFILKHEIPNVAESSVSPYIIRKEDYCVDEKVVIKLLAKYFGPRSREALRYMENKGFLIRVGEGYRSLHMDVLVRSAYIRTHHYREPYILSPRFNVYLLPLPSREDRVIRPEKSAGLSTELRKAIDVFFGDRQLADNYVKIMRDYLSSNSSWGLDPFQAKTLRNLFLSNKDIHIITAPTGSGKTIIFSLYIIAKLLKYKAENVEKHFILVYPRKVLSIDQAERLISLLDICKQHGFDFTFALRDGSTIRDKEFYSNLRKGFRGIRCKCGGDLVYYHHGKLKTISCSKCGKIYDFVCATREEMSRRKPDIVVTNMWTLEVRLLDSNVNDINASFLSNIDTVVIDEAHEFRGLSAGLVSILLKTLRQISGSKVIISSATVPKPIDFASKLLGVTKSEIAHHDFYEYLSSSLNIIKGRRLAIVALFDMNPRYSWSTYVQLWSVMISFINYVYRLDGRQYVPQAIVFVNNIKELRRIHRGYEENISLGEPRDHLFEELHEKLSPLDPFSYAHYCTDFTWNKLISILSSDGRIKELMNLTDEMHSLIGEDKRKRIIKLLKGGRDLAVVLSTSSLELGVDYDNISFILNVGIDNHISLAQRIGRGGRTASCLRTVLGIILTRNIPTEVFTLYDPFVWEKLNPSPKRLEGFIPVTSDNPQVINRELLTKSINDMALRDERTYASGSGINDVKTLVNFLSSVADNVSRVI